VQYLASAFTTCHQNAASKMVLDLVWKYFRTIVECFYFHPKPAGIWKPSQHSTSPRRRPWARGTGEDGGGSSREGGATSSFP